MLTQDQVHRLQVIANKIQESEVKCLLFLFCLDELNGKKKLGRPVGSKNKNVKKNKQIQKLTVA